MSFQVKTFDDLVSDMVGWLVANSPQITDLTPGSVIRSFCEATSMSIEELYVSTYLGFRRYLAQIPEIIFDFEKQAGAKATVNVVFSRTGTTGVVVIPIGTEVKTTSGLSFFTTALSEIADGNTDSANVEVEAEEVGTDYNVLSATIIVMGSTVNGIETVTNALPATGGLTEESDYQYNQRFQAYTEGLAGSNIAGLITGALTVEGITSVSVHELFPPVANVNANLYIDDGTVSSVSAEKIAEVQTIIDGDGTADVPGYRSAGVNVVVVAPFIVTQNMTFTVSVISGVDSDQILEDVEASLTDYVNNLGVGADIVYNELVAAVMETFGVYDCSITVPSANVSIDTTQVGRLGTLTSSAV